MVSYFVSYVAQFMDSQVLAMSAIYVFLLFSIRVDLFWT